jgi:hypothetical protein
MTIRYHDNLNDYVTLVEVYRNRMQITDGQSSPPHELRWAVNILLDLPLLLTNVT